MSSRRKKTTSNKFFSKLISWIRGKSKKIIAKVRVPRLPVIKPRVWGILLIVVAVVLIAIPEIYKAKELTPDDSQTNTSTPEVKATPTAEGPIHIDSLLFGAKENSQPPLRIIVPKRQIDISIVEAPVINGAWELSETTASHGIGSANPGEIGNVVVFAHARAGLFLPLRDIEKNELIYILTKDRWHRYQVSETKLVNPDQVEVISQTNEEKLTLFTCTGFLDSKRLIVTAIPYRP